MQLHQPTTDPPRAPNGLTALRKPRSCRVASGWLLTTTTRGLCPAFMGAMALVTLQTRG